MGQTPSKKRFDLMSLGQTDAPSCQSNSDCSGYYNTNSTNTCNNVICDPNMASCSCADNSLGTGSITGLTGPVNSAGYSCTADTDCKHINEELSRPNNIVYACPSATCNEGTCSCGSDCQLDPYSGLCCNDIQTVYPGSDAFCVMSAKKPSVISSTMSPNYSTFIPQNAFRRN